MNTLSLTSGSQPAGAPVLLGEGAPVVPRVTLPLAPAAGPRAAPAELAREPAPVPHTPVLTLALALHMRLLTLHMCLLNPQGLRHVSLRTRHVLCPAHPLWRNSSSNPQALRLHGAGLHGGLPAAGLGSPMNPHGTQGLHALPQPLRVLHASGAAPPPAWHACCAAAPASEQLEWVMHLVCGAPLAVRAGVVRS